MCSRGCRDRGCPFGNAATAMSTRARRSTRAAPGTPGMAASVYGARSACTRSMSWTSCAALLEVAEVEVAFGRAHRRVSAQSEEARDAGIQEFADESVGTGVGVPDACEVSERRDGGLAPDEAKHVQRTAARRATGAVGDRDEARTGIREVADRLVQRDRPGLGSSAGRPPEGERHRRCAQVDGHIGASRQFGTKAAGRPRIAHPAVRPMMRFHRGRVPGSVVAPLPGPPTGGGTVPADDRATIGPR